MNTEWRNGTRYTRGPWAQVVAYRAVCPDGVARVTAWVAGSPDTFFSHAAAVRVGRVRVRGFVTFTDDVPHFVPNVDSVRPAGWLYDVCALRNMRARAFDQASSALSRARAARWSPVPNGDASPKNKRRCARLVARYVADVRAHRTEAARLARVITRAYLHNQLVPGEHAPFRVESVTSDAPYLRDLTYATREEATASAERTLDGLRWAYEGRTDVVVRVNVVDASERRTAVLRVTGAAYA